MRDSDRVRLESKTVRGIGASASDPSPGFAMVLVGVAVAVAVAVSLAVSLPSSVVLGLLTMVIAIATALLASGRDRKLQSVLLSAVAVRLVVAAVDTYVLRVPGSGNDSATFERTAEALSSLSWAELADTFSTGSRMLSWLAAFIYKVVGISTLMIKALLAVLGMLTVRNVFLLIRELAGDRPAYRGAWAAALFPTMVLFSGVFLREAPIGFLVSGALLALVRGLTRRSIISFVVAVVFSALAAAFHTGMLAVFAGLLLVALLETMRGVRRARSTTLPRGLTLAIMAVAAVAVLATTGWGLDRLGGTLETLTFETIETNQERAARGTAAYLTGFTVGSPLEAAVYGPIRLTYFWLTPFPWMVRDLSHLLGLVDALLLLLASATLIRHRKRLGQTPRGVMVLVVFVTISFAFALGTSNFGTAVRHRAKIAPLLISLVYVVAAPNPNQRLARSSASTGSPDVQRSALPTGLGTVAADGA